MCEQMQPLRISEGNIKILDNNMYAFADDSGLHIRKNSIIRKLHYKINKELI